MKIGAWPEGEDRCRFRVWAPFAQNMTLQLLKPQQLDVPMQVREDGYFEVSCSHTPPGSLYRFLLPGGQQLPDPASRYQPGGDVHGPSQVVDQSAFSWTDQSWRMFPQEDILAYELHTGTFTPEGTFEAIVSRLGALQELGVNTLNLMPVAQFPGTRNWGYDGMQPFAVQNSYGGPQGLKRLVDTCHRAGMAVFLDVVYNHLGPEGNYLEQFGPYFTDTYRTPWGRALNFDGAHSDQVRNYFIENALYWFREFHLDGLRLDAVHAILDMSAKPFLQELGERVDAYQQERNTPVLLVPESDLNDTRLIRSRAEGGFGHNAQWNDDFHHALHALLTGERQGYYQDFGQISHLVKSFTNGYIYTWNYSSYRRRHHGNASGDLPGSRFVVFSQNHDQVGNRLQGDRMSRLAPFEALKLGAACLLLSPFLPLLFMGEEYGEEAPFQYFVSHTDPELIDAVREGRKQEFAAFDWQGEPPDPQAEATFQASKLQWDLRDRGHHKQLLDFYRELIQLRRRLPALAHPDTGRLTARGDEGRKTMTVERRHAEGPVCCLFNFNSKQQLIRPEHAEGSWIRVLDSAESRHGGPGSVLPASFIPGQELRIGPLSAAVFCLQSDSLQL